MVNSDMKKIAIRESIKVAAMKKIANEEEQIAPFRAGGIKMSNDAMFQAALKRVLGGLYKNANFTNDIMPSPGVATDYQAIVFGTKVPRYYNDIETFRGREFIYGLKNFDLGEPLEFDDEDSKNKLGLEGVPDEVPLQSTCGWFKDETTDEYKLLVIVPAPRKVFNRVAKVPKMKPPQGPDKKDNPHFEIKTIVDSYTKYLYDYPIKFGQSLFEKTYIEYSFLFQDEFVMDKIKLNQSAGGAGFKRKIDGVSIKNIVESFEDPVLDGRGQPHPIWAAARPALISRTTRDAVDLNPPADDTTQSNMAWKQGILSARQVPVAKKKNTDLDFGVEAPKEDKPKGPGVDYMDVQPYKIYNRDDLETGTKALNGMQDLLDNNDFKVINSWTSSDYQPPEISWAAGDPRFPEKSALIKGIIRFPKNFSKTGMDHTGTAGGLYIDMSFDGMSNVENPFDAYIQTKDYLETVPKGRITGIEGSRGQEQSQFGQHKEAENSLYRQNKSLIDELNDKIDGLIETNIKYRNEVYSRDRPVYSPADGILKYLADLKLFAKKLSMQTPKGLTELNNLLERPGGAQKIRRSDVNLLRIIFDDKK